MCALNVFVMNAFLALPGILLAIAFVAFLGPGMRNLVLALSIGGWVGYARLVRAQVLAVKKRNLSKPPARLALQTCVSSPGTFCLTSCSR